jgi:uncharacterized protein (TIGR03118 family)
VFGLPAAADTRVTTRFAEVDLVSDQAIAGVLREPDVVNAWGLALSPTSPLWVANNGTNTATVYLGGVGSAPVTKAPLTVAIPGGAPTGQVFNDTDQFVVGATPALFLFVSEGGDLTAWNPALATNAVVVKHVEGAVYKGLTLLHTRFGPFLLAADFHNGRIDVFDGSFRRIVLPNVFFRDRHLPRGYAPFNVFASGSRVYVAYAKQTPGSNDEMAGPGLGIIDRYTSLGLEVERIASHGTLNAPWGMAIAPASFGRFAGDLLVGNFGDGHIGAYRGDDFHGLLRDSAGHPLAIDGLWALQPGTASTGGIDAVWFSAGPGEEQHGLVGKIVPAS